MLPESATRYDIARSLGDNRVFVITHRSSAGGAPVDLTGIAAELVFYDSETGADMATLSTANVGIAALDATGEIRIDLAHDDYVALAAEKYTYRLNLSASGLTRPLLRGSWSVTGNI